MGSEQQYIDLYKQCRGIICEHSSDVMNAVRDEAFERFASSGFPSRKVERYKYTDMQALFAPDYGLNLNRLQIPVDPYNAFRCDVPNLSTSLYFVVNDMLYRSEKLEVRGERIPHASAKLPEGVIIGSLKELSSHPSPLTSHLYNKLAGKANDAATDLNTMLAQDGLYVYVPRNVKVDRAIQVINILRSDERVPKSKCCSVTMPLTIKISWPHRLLRPLSVKTPRWISIVWKRRMRRMSV